MAGKKFSAILTGAGEAALAAAALSGVPVGFSVMAVGDGGGSLPEPNPEQTQLVNEVYRAPLNRLIIVEQRANIIRAEMLIPARAGGFWLREAALYDDAGVCLAVANLPESYKPQLTEGSGRLHSVNLWIAVNNTADVELKSDPSVILATVDEVNKAGMRRRTTPIRSSVIWIPVFSRLSLTLSLRRVGTSGKKKTRRGTVRFFAQNIDPNEKWPWSQWTYTGENKTIRIGKADGSNIGQTGGNDTVTLQQANLPAVQIEVSGETSERSEEKLTTTPGGVHNHGGVAGKDDPWEIGGDVRQLFNPKELGVTDDAGEHDHQVTIPPHKHTTSGKTANLGEGKSFSVVEAHTLLMCWARVA